MEIRGGIPNPNKIDHFVAGMELDDLQSLAREVSQATSWAGGGTPKPEYQNLWTEQATREISGHPTQPPLLEYFMPKVSHARPMQPGQEITLRNA